MFDYILTGPISGVAAGQYLAGLISELLQYTHLGNPLTAYQNNFVAADSDSSNTFFFFFFIYFFCCCALFFLRLRIAYSMSCSALDA